LEPRPTDAVDEGELDEEIRVYPTRLYVPVIEAEAIIWVELRGIPVGRRIGRESIPVSMLDCGSWRWENWTVKAKTSCSLNWPRTLH
jgi:hypothetical protein